MSRGKLAELRGPGVPPRSLDARALAALAANPGCRRRALLDGAGIDKGALARALGSPAPYGQSQFAIVRGNAFEARVKADGGTELLRLLYERLAAPGTPPPEPGAVAAPELSAAGPEGRAARTALALREATAAGGWTLLDHPLLAVGVAGAPAYVEPDALVVHPDGTWTVVEIKSFPMIDGSADAAKVGAAARQAAVYALALEPVAEHVGARTGRAVRVDDRVLLVCPKDFSNLPAAAAVDVRKQLATTRRQLGRLTRVEEIAAALPEGTTFDLRLTDDGRAATRPPEELAEAVEAVDAAYVPECLAACELAFHCRERARAEGAVAVLGRGVWGELGGLRTVGEVLAAAGAPQASGTPEAPGSPQASAGQDGPDDPAVLALRRAAALRAEALGAEALGAEALGAEALRSVPEVSAGVAAVPSPRGAEEPECR
ncbi:hypothetical protein [Streptomyces sp. NBRC 110611]|uniref:hypothetical protein n=1 Tax=Streptomyces sp. NBRC 110611 TaxID=1621259 RepID=UPI00082D7B0A|nr:hypothetical protein [Streptomyces sp. NBRC 110611]